MDLAYVPFCRAQHAFYDEPPALVAQQYPHHVAPTPCGWARVGTGEWVYYHPVGMELPQQGWKIHASATPQTAEKVLEAVWDHCLTQRLPFKTLATPMDLVRRNSKYADRSGSGKFATIYPADDGALQSSLRALDEALGGLAAPTILSDLRWGAGPLHVRYGAFVSRRRTTADGRVLECIQAPDGELVEDVRRPGFHPPDWVAIPDFLAPHLQARNERRLRGFDFQVQRALHFSNGGGVYLARDRSGTEILLKEARPYCGLDELSNDAVHRLEREHAALDALSGVDGVPRLIGTVDGVEHRFLAREFVAGRPLHELIAATNPLANPLSPMTRTAYAAWATAVLRQVERGVAAMHARGWVFGDLHPGNVLVSDSGSVGFIDFESSAPEPHDYLQALGAFGYRAPSHLRGTAVDDYALGCLSLALFVPLPKLVSLTPHGAAAVTEYARAQFDVAPEVVSRLGQRLGTAAGDDEDSGVLDTPADPAKLTEALARHATPERTDRLFPGDIRQFLSPGGGLSLGYGAAGVLWTLEQLGQPVSAEHLDWVRARARESLDSLPVGLWTGLAGLALALEGLAPEVSERAVALAAQRVDTVVDPTLAAGLSGLGLYLLDRLDRGLPTPEGALAACAARTVSWAPARTASAGLCDGASGAAMFAARYAARTSDAPARRAATLLLDAEVARYGLDTDDVVPESLPVHGNGLAGGVVGVGLALADYESAFADDRYAAARRRVDTIARGAVGVNGGVLCGQAGLVHYLLQEPPGPARDAALRRHTEIMRWFRVRVDGVTLALGDACLKFSLDLGSGLAGHVLTEASVRRGHSLLPLLSWRPEAATGSELVG